MTSSQKQSVTSLPLFSIDGKETGTVALPEALFSAPANKDLVHQVVVGMQANARKPIGNTKGRGEVRGGGKKPWKQKGTGRARHGSSRSPIWKGGGVTHGPTKERVYEVKINKKMRFKALVTVLSEKARAGKVILVESFTLAAPKTKEAQGLIASLAKGTQTPTLLSKKKNAALITISSPALTVKKSFKNIPNLSVEEVRNLNPVDVLSSSYLVIVDPETSFKALLARE